MRSRSFSDSAAVALASLALIGCELYNERPPDGGAPAPDATAPAPDASPLDRPIDAAVADATPFQCDSSTDSREPNDTADAAPRVAASSSGDNPGWIWGGWELEACVAGTNEDWYRITASELRFDVAEPPYDGEPTLRLRLQAKGASLCPGEPCNGFRLPDAPANTVTVTVYAASTMEELATESSTHGLIFIDAVSEYFDEDVLVRVAGPPEALYDYRLTVSIDAYGSEDECEC